MSRPLSPSERVLRMHIRNAFLIATLQELENEIERRTEREKLLDVRFLKELKEELELELFVARQKATFTPLVLS